MSAVTPELIKEVREKTGIGLLKCKKALLETNGDVSQAIENLRKQGLQAAEKKMGREATEGKMFSYIHATGKLAVLLELGCETDFVARTEDFDQLGKDICMHIAATGPQYLKREDVPEDVVAKEKEILAEQIKDKPENVVEKIVEGRMKKFFEENCLLDMPFVKDDSQTIDGLVRGVIAKLGENMMVRRFVRMEVGES